MNSYCKLVTPVMLPLLLGLFAALGSAPGAHASHLRSVTAITEVFGDGQKVSALAVEYDGVLDTTKLKTSDFAVEGKAVTRVYANTNAAKAAQGVNGNYAIIELSTAILPDLGFSPRIRPPGNAAPGGAPGNGPGANPPPGPGGPKIGQVATDSATSPPLTVHLRQRGDLISADGQTFPAEGGLRINTTNLNLMLDGFEQRVYQDPGHTNAPLTYNLFIPKNYDPSQKYPLVLFLHDAGAVSKNPTKTLTQGLGAVIWATPAEQAKHACFVLAPQYDSVIVDDACQPTEQMDITVDLVKSLAQQYSIDRHRLYNTGQSMGGMTAMAMDIEYPDLFAASLLVACQWDAAQVAPLAKKNLWIIVSEGDAKAKPGMDAVTQVLTQQGATVSKATWSAEASAPELAVAVRRMLAAGGNIQYTVFKQGNHRYTWQHAYGIAGVRDWLFAQKN